MYFFVAPTSDGRRRSTEKVKRNPHPDGQPTLEVRSGTLGEVSSLIGSLRGNDLLIAIEKPPAADDEALSIGIAGRGFDGNLTSDSTRLDGYVLSTDIAPTILERFGIAVPTEMSGQPIRAEGDGRPGGGGIARRADGGDPRASRAGDRLLPARLARAAGAARGRRAGGGSPGRACGWSASRSSTCRSSSCSAPRSSRARGSNSSSSCSARRCSPPRPWRRSAATGRWPSRAALTVLAYAVDVVAGSPLTSLSLLGPNPGLGVRFYGIGNELEALLAVLVVAGTGAALTGFAPRASSRAQITAFLATGLVSAFVFAAGRFGADVGAAIVLPLGAAVAAATLGGRRRRALLLAVAAPVAAVALLALVDLLSGANAHLTRSVLDAGGLDELAEVAQRRLQLSAHSFARPIVYVFLPLLAAVAALAYAWRDRIASWLAGRPAMRAGLPAPSRRPCSAPSPTTPAPSCSRSAPPICSSSPASPGPRRATHPAVTLSPSCASRLSRHIPGPIRAA